MRTATWFLTLVAMACCTAALATASRAPVNAAVEGPEIVMASARAEDVSPGVAPLEQSAGGCYDSCLDACSYESQRCYARCIPDPDCMRRCDSAREQCVASCRWRCP